MELRNRICARGSEEEGESYLMVRTEEELGVSPFLVWKSRILISLPFFKSPYHPIEPQTRANSLPARFGFESCY